MKWKWSIQMISIFLILIGCFLLLCTSAAPALPKRANLSFVKVNITNVSGLSLNKKKMLPADHLDAVRLEVDSHLNHDYRREIFFGENHDKIQPKNDFEAKRILKRLFLRVDADKDGKWSGDEIENWVMHNIQEHLNAARKENEAVFHALDTDRNGLITYREFLVQLMIALGHNKTMAERYPDDYSLIPLGQDETTSMSRNRFRWSQADLNMDNQLNKTEFLAFRHPELSSSMIQHMVEDMISNLDKNSDGMLSAQEFAPLPPGEVETPFPGFVNDDNKWQQERMSEFKNRLDADHNGLASSQELRAYVDPGSPYQAAAESRNLMTLADHNKDGVLSLNEVLENHELFIGSKLVNVARSFHEEL